MNGSLSVSRSCRTEGNKLPSGCTEIFYKHVCRGCQKQYIIRSVGLKAVQWPEQCTLWYFATLVVVDFCSAKLLFKVNPVIKEVSFSHF